MSNCAVHLDNLQEQYYLGSTITGRVVCSFNSPKSIRAVKVRLKGHEHTHWTKQESYYDSVSKKTRYRTVHYNGDNTVLYMEQELSGEGDYPAGRHEYQFTFVLPTKLPATFYNQYGGIQYLVKAVVDRPYRFDYENETYFKLAAPVNFNDIPGLQMDQVAYSDDKNICCCCCASGPITMNVHLDKEAFVMGEVAKVKVEITNMSNVNVEGVRAKIGLTVRSVATSPKYDSKYDYELVASDRASGVGAHGANTYNFELEIPQSTAVYNFTSSQLFSQYGTLEVTAELPSCHKNMDISSSITLGHIPLRGHEPNLQTPYPAPPYSPAQNGLPQGTSYPPNAPPCPSGDSSLPPYPSASLSSVFPKVHDSSASAHIGFTVSSKPEIPSLPSGVLPPELTSNTPFLPSPPSSSYTPNAPPPDSAPSAPCKADVAEEGDFVMIDEGEDEPVPPSYDDAMKNALKSHPPK